MSLSVLAIAFLATCAIILIGAFRATGFGLLATVALGVATTLAVWGGLHLLYFSDSLETSLFAAFLPRGADGWTAQLESPSRVGISWLPLYLASLGWRFGLVFYATVWFVSKLLLKDKHRPLRLEAHPASEAEE